MIPAIGIYCFVALLAAAVWTDLRSRRIPNALTVTAFALALLLRATAGVSPLLSGILGAGLALLLLLPLFAVGGMGGGDAKLLIGVGALFGPKGFLIALLCTALAGGILSLVAAARKRIILPMLLSTGDLARYWVSGGRHGESVSLASPGALSVPYALAIGIGCVAALLLSGGI